MKITRQDLIRAQNKQLATIGVTRDGNAGWLGKAMEMEFTPEEVEVFHKARKARKQKSPKISDRVVLPPLDHKQSEIDRLKSELKNAHEALSPFALFASTFMGRDDHMTPVAKVGNQSLTIGALQRAREILFPKLWCAMCGKWGDHRSGTCPELRPSAEQFANDLFEKSERDLS